MKTCHYVNNDECNLASNISTYWLPSQPNQLDSWKLQIAFWLLPVSSKYKVNMVNAKGVAIGDNSIVKGVFFSNWMLAFILWTMGRKSLAVQGNNLATYFCKTVMFCVLFLFFTSYFDHSSVRVHKILDICSCLVDNYFLPRTSTISNIVRFTKVLY